MITIKREMQIRIVVIILDEDCVAKKHISVYSHSIVLGGLFEMS